MVAHVGYVHGGALPGGSATVTFDSGGAQVDSAAIVEWDFDNDGDFTDTANEDITTHVETVQVTAGRDFPSQLSGKAGPGKLQLQARNDDDRFSFFNADSPLNQGGRSLRIGRKIRVRVNAERALLVTGGALGMATTTDKASLDITGDQTIGAEFVADGLATIQTLYSKFTTSGDQRSIMLQINATGFPRLLWTTAGTLASQVIATSTQKLTSLKRTAVWAALDVDNGGNWQVRFYWAHRRTDTPELLSTINGVGTTSVFSGSAIVRVGGFDPGPTEPFVGHIYWAEHRAGLITSTDYRANPDFAGQLTGASSFVDGASTANTWTVVSPAALVNDPVENLDEPTLLGRDRFNRDNQATIGYMETGQPWLFSHVGEGYQIRNDQAEGTQEGGASAPGARRIAFFDTGQTEHYVQCSVGRLATFGGNRVGLIAGRIDGDNYVFIEAATDGVSVGHVVAGVSTEIAFSGFYSIWPGHVLGLRVTPSGNCYGYLNGMELFAPDGLIPFVTTLQGGTGAGVVYRWDTTSNLDCEPPRLDNFWCWDRKVAELPGVLWTGQVTEVKPSVEAGPRKSVQVTAEGQLATAAGTDVQNPRSIQFARPANLIGSTLAAAELLHPPGIIECDKTTLSALLCGANTGDDGDALTLCRRFEETERGFLYEMNEGHIGYQLPQSRDEATALAQWSDAPGAQFAYEQLEPLDQRRDIVNRVTAGVAPAVPTLVSVTSDSAATVGGVANNVTVGPLPAVEKDDLLVVFIASTVGSNSVQWLTPLWWRNHRQELRGEIRERVYSHHCDGSEGGTSVTFYVDSTNSGGNWDAQIYWVRDWYQGGDSSVAISPFVSGHNPPALTTGFGKIPTLFIAVAAALTSAAGGGIIAGSNQKFPNGYRTTLGAVFADGSVNGFDLGHLTCHRFALAEGDNPDSFVMFQGFAINESAVFAIRGYDGEHLLLPTLKNPNQFQASPGRFVTVDDHEAQDGIRSIRSHVNPSNLFRQESDASAYATLLLERFKDDRPIFRLGFTANKNAGYRRQAFERRVGDKIHLVAANNSGMGVEAGFFIESVSHGFSDGVKLWEVEWELSPAP